MYLNLDSLWAARVKGEAVDGAWPIFFEHCKVKFRAVAFVAVKSILSVFFVESKHEPVSCDFGNYGSRHALENGGICFHDSCLRYG